MVARRPTIVGWCIRNMMALWRRFFGFDSEPGKHRRIDASARLQNAGDTGVFIAP